MPGGDATRRPARQCKAHEETRKAALFQCIGERLAALSGAGKTLPKMDVAAEIAGFEERNKFQLGDLQRRAVELALEEGGVAALLSVNYTWQLLFVGNQPGPIGVTSILGCLIGVVLNQTDPLFLQSAL